MSNPPHSELEVVPGSLEAGDVSSDTHKIPYATNYAHDTHKIPYATDYTHESPYGAVVHEKAQPSTICGMRKKIFWIVMVIAIVVVVAAIGAGLGASLSQKKAGSPAGSPAGSSTTPTPTSAEPSTPVTTTTLVSGSASIQRDCPSSNNTIYSINVSGTTMQFRKACEATFVNANNRDAMVVQPFASLDKCIDACAQYNMRNRTQIQQGKSSICNSVCWRNDFVQRDKWPGGMCLGWTTQNTTSGGFKYQLNMPFPETACDSAALINQDF